VVPIAGSIARAPTERFVMPPVRAVQRARERAAERRPGSSCTGTERYRSPRNRRIRLPRTVSPVSRDRSIAQRRAQPRSPSGVLALTAARCTGDPPVPRWSSRGDGG
jgi:hypothetical protein